MIQHPDTLFADATNPVQVELIGVTNPDTDTTLSFWLFIMNSGASSNNDEHARESY